MLVDWLIYGLLVFGAAKLLNVTAFKQKSASRLAAWSLSILMSIVSVVALSVLKVLRYQAISDSVGVPISPQNPLDMGAHLYLLGCFSHFLIDKRKSNRLAQEGSNESEYQTSISCRVYCLNAACTFSIRARHFIS
jgi:hypothetical protein